MTSNFGFGAAAIILGITLVVSLLGLFGAPRIIDAAILRPYWLVRRKEYHRLITCGFVHADIGHLLFNAITFYSFAFPLERYMGTERFLVLYSAGLLVSSLGTWYKHRNDPNYASLGASGAILAVLFAAILYFPDQSLYILPIPVPIPAPVFAVGYLAYTWWSSKQAREMQRGRRINHDAHLSGALTGVAFVLLTDPDVLRRFLG